MRYLKGNACGCTAMRRASSRVSRLAARPVGPAPPRNRHRPAPWPLASRMQRLSVASSTIQGGVKRRGGRVASNSRESNKKIPPGQGGNFADVRWSGF